MPQRLGPEAGTRLERFGPDALGEYHEIIVTSDCSREWGGTCGSSLWASSPALILWMCSDPSRLSLIRGKSILEIGSGLGFVGLALGALGARRVLCTDLPEQQALLAHNVQANASGRCKVESTPFVWGTPPPPAIGRHYDLVVACDVLYDEAHVEPLATSLAALLCPTTDKKPNKKRARPSVPLVPLVEGEADAVSSEQQQAATSEAGEPSTLLKRQPPEAMMAAPPTKVLLALPDRTDFGRTVSPTDPEPLPDYETLLRAIEVAMPRALIAERLDSIPPELSGTLSSHVDVILLSAGT